MCDYCKHVLSGVCSPHTILNCSYRKSMYCYICASYGHIVAHCPNKRAKAIRQGKSVKGVTNLVFTISSKQEEIQKFLLQQRYIEVKSTYVPEVRYKAFLRDYVNSMNPPHMLQFVD